MLLKFFEKFKNKLLDLMYPENLKCIFCGDELNETAINSTCPTCYENLPRIMFPCLKCGSPLDNADTPVCMNCKAHNSFFEKARSSFIYKDEILLTVQNLKYNGNCYLVKPMAKYMAETYATMGINVDYITYVPLTKAKETERGFNQAKLLADEISNLIHIPVLNLFEKIKDTPSQTALGITSRRDNIKDSFKLTSERKLAKGKKILIVDDVITTGATTSELSKTALDGKVKTCFVLTFASTKFEKEN